jgi:hypothetical protein
MTFTPALPRRPFSSALWRVGVVVVVAGCLGVLAPPLAAQEAPRTCEALLDEAEEQYVAQTFGAAIATARRCLDRPDATTEEARHAYRLITLIYLQQRNPRAAEETMAALLQADPTYRPDPVQDPPVFYAFAEAFVARRSPPPPVVDPSPPAEVSLGLRLGTASYGGERGVPASNLFSEFTANAGWSAGVNAGVELAEWVRAGARLDVHLLTSRFNHAIAPPVNLRREDSSNWVGLVSVEAVATPPLPEIAPVRLFGSLGLGAAFTRLNGDLSTGFLLQPGLGVEVPVTPQVVPFVLFEVGVVLPGEALDLRNVSHLREGTRNHDLVTAVGFGVRYVIAPR